MHKCPKCGADSLRRSRTRSLWETVRKGVFRKRLYKCGACQWRGWLDETRAAAVSASWNDAVTDRYTADTALASGAVRRVTELDLTRLDEIDARPGETTN